MTENTDEKSPIISNLKDHVKSQGLNEKAFERILFRLSFIERGLASRIKVLEAGNLARWEPEAAQHVGMAIDLLDTLREVVTLLHENFRQEQGLATPPNDRKSDETPGSP